LWPAITIERLMTGDFIDGAPLRRHCEEPNGRRSNPDF
jgi:hypothetical protein